MNQATQAATQLVVAKSLPFVVSHDDVNRTIMLSPKDANGARLDADNLAAGRALQGTPHVLGVEVPTAVRPPYCGTVPGARMDAPTRAVADALIRLHLGEQDLDYFIRTQRGLATLDVIRTQVRIDEAFRRELASIRMPGTAAGAVPTVLDGRARYDATLSEAASRLEASDLVEYRRLIGESEQQRTVASQNLDALRAELDYPPNTCHFLAP